MKKKYTVDESGRMQLSWEKNQEVKKKLTRMEIVIVCIFLIAAIIITN